MSILQHNPLLSLPAYAWKAALRGASESCAAVCFTTLYVAFTHAADEYIIGVSYLCFDRLQVDFAHNNMVVSL